MAEQLTNALVTPSAELVTATVNVPGTTAFDVTWNEPSPPTVGTYSLIFKGAATDGSDDSIFRVATMSDTDSIATGSWEKVGAQASFTAGCEIDLDHSAAALTQVVSDHDGGTTRHASATNLIHTTGNETKAGILTLSNPLYLANGSAAAPSDSFASDTDVGSFRVSSNVYGVATGGSERLRVNSGGILVTGSVTPTGALNNGLGPIGTTLNLALGTTPSELEVTVASCTINLPVIAWSRNNTPVYIIKDPNQILTSCKIYPYDDTFGIFCSINEALTGEQIWSDVNSGTTGPDGIYADLTTTGSMWRLSAVEVDPGVAVGVGGAAATGGWNLDKISTGGFT